MVDPNRKINLHASDYDSDEEEEELNEEHVQMIKEFEEVSNC